MLQFNHQEWVHLGQWVQPTLSSCFWNNWTQHNKKYPFTIGTMDGRLPFLNGHHFVWKSDVDVLRAFVQKNHSNFELLKTLEAWVDDVHESAKKMMALPCDTLVDALKNMKSSCKDIVNPWIFFLVLDGILEQEMIAICKREGYDFDSVVAMIKPLRKSFTVIQSEEAAFLHENIRKKGLRPDFSSIQMSDPSLALEIQEHVNRFAFVGMHHFVGEPYSIQQFLEAKPALSVLVTGQTSNIPQELKWHMQLASLAAFARTHMAETSGFIQYTIRPVLLKVNEKLSLANDDYLWLTATELITALETPEGFTKPDISLRKEMFGILPTEHSSEMVIVGSAVERAIRELLPKKEISATSAFPLFGRIASAGKVIGIARIVIKPEDITKVLPGDILVAPETSPDFIVGLKRAGGVITNQGGITSHAAIVSRELGVPCLVGVQNATSLIKDGVLIELDAIHGLVRAVK